MYRKEVVAGGGEEEEESQRTRQNNITPTWSCKMESSSQWASGHALGHALWGTLWGTLWTSVLSFFQYRFIYTFHPVIIVKIEHFDPGHVLGELHYPFMLSTKLYVESNMISTDHDGLPQPTKMTEIQASHGKLT